MKKGTKEFNDVIYQFEKDLPIMPVYTGATPERENYSPKIYYTNGKIHELFIAYMWGYVYGKEICR